MDQTRIADIERVRELLVRAEATRTAVEPVSGLVPGGLTIDDGHRVCEANIERRVRRGERIIGFKVGFTNVEVRAANGLPDSTYGYLFEPMILPSGGTLSMDELIAPKIETEICFRMGADLSGDPGLEHVLDATEAVCAAFEIPDPRIKGSPCPYPDVLADNGFAARVVLSGAWRRPRDIDLAGERVVLLQDGRQIAEGRGEQALGHPANSVSWLVRKLGERGRRLQSGMIVMTGTLPPILPIARGSTYVASFSTLGSVAKAFL